MEEKLHQNDETRQALAVAAVRAGRRMSEAFRRHRPPIGDLEYARIQSALRRIEDGDVLAQADEWLLAALLERVEVAVNMEVLGIDQNLECVGGDTSSLEYELVQKAIYSDRGHRLLEVQNALEEFMYLRAEIRDRATGKKALLALEK